MEGVSVEQNNIPEIITNEWLIDFAKTRDFGDPKIREMLLLWIDQTIVPEGEDRGSLALVDIAIMHTVMKYRLGFLTKYSVLDELEEERLALVSESDAGQLQQKFYNLVDDIINDNFEVIKFNDPVKSK
jgi:hypothetical protein